MKQSLAYHTGRLRVNSSYSVINEFSTWKDVAVIRHSISCQQ